MGGGKVAIATSATNGLQISALSNFSITCSAGTVGETHIVYPNFWVTDNKGDYALIALDVVSGLGQDDTPVYNTMASPGGMSKSYFDSLAIRVYDANTANLNWLYPVAVAMVKAAAGQPRWTSSPTLPPATRSWFRTFRICISGRRSRP